MQLMIRISGIIGLILCVIPFQFKKHKHIVLCKMASELTFALQYLLMGLSGVAGAYTGALIDLVSGGRNFLYHRFVSLSTENSNVYTLFSVFSDLIKLIFNCPPELKESKFLHTLYFIIFYVICQ